MRGLAGDPAARGLTDDAAVLRFGGETLVLTHDMMVEGVHWLTPDDPADVAWKLVAANLSDLAAKGAEPVGLLLGFMLGDDEWDARFAIGLGEAVEAFGAPLLGGDTVSASASGARALGMTAIGRATSDPVPARSGARLGDLLCVTGTIGDAFAGFRLGADAAAPLRAAHLRPAPRLAEGQALAPHTRAMMDVSDGMLIDAARMAAASGCRATIELGEVPLSDAFVASFGRERDVLIEAFAWGDDYELLVAWPADRPVPASLTAVGYFVAGEGLTLTHSGTPVPVPARLGFEHG